MLPPRVRAPVAAWLGPVELVTGAALIGGWAGGAEVLVRASVSATGLLLVSFAGYLALVLRRDPRAPCGCFGQGRVSGWAVARAALPGLAAVVCACAPLPAHGRWTTLLGAVLVALVLWVIPQVSDLRRGGAADPRARLHR